MQAAHFDNTLSSYLTDLEAAVQAVVQHAEDPAIQDPVRRFLQQVYQLGLALQTHPDWQDAPELHQFLDRTAPILAHATSPLLQFSAVLENRLYGTWEGDWRTACEQRSSLAFLLTIYQGTTFAETLTELDDLSDLDSVMEQVANTEGYIASDAIPPGIPRSHWWWYST